jgi:hypothetical protein
MIGKAIPFEIPTFDNELVDLLKRLSNTRYPHGKYQFHDNGTLDLELDRLKSLAEKWKSNYSFPKFLEKLKKYPHYQMNIEGNNVHFVYIKNDRRKPALLLLHGWPSSFLEFWTVIDTLKTHFDLIIPSLPGFGFSTPIVEKGMGVREMARILNELMISLGYLEYSCQCINVF